MICRIAVVGDEFQVFNFPVDRQALRSARRVSHWMRTCAVTESFTAASRGPTNRRNRRRMSLPQTRMRRLQIRSRRNRVVRSHDRSREYDVSRVGNHRVMTMEDIVRADRSEATSNRRRPLRSHRAKIVVTVTVIEKHPW